MRVEITHHAAARGAKRLGLPRAAVARMARKAWAEGVPASPIHYPCRRGVASRLCGNGVYFFHRKPDDVVLLLTVVRVDQRRHQENGHGV